MGRYSIKKISIDNWELFSDRRNSKSYFSKDKKWLLKIPTDKYNTNLDDLLKEKEISDNAIKCGVPTPIVKDVVMLQNDKYGIIYEYIDDKISLARAISKDFDNVEKYIEKFVNIGSIIHNIKCDKTKYLNIEDRIREELIKHDIYTDDEKKVMLKFMEQIEKKDTFLHVDYHTGNVITSSKGEYLIDVSLLSYGNPIYDYGVWYMFSKKTISEQDANDIFHIGLKKLEKCWDLFVEKQFNIMDLKEKEELEEKLAPIGILTLTAHLSLIPRIDVHKKIKELHFKKAFGRYLN